MSNENNKMQVVIENLFKQNVNDLSAIKELYRKLKEVDEKISQIKYIDSTLANKLKKDYDKFKKIILDDIVQAKLTNDIETINSQLYKIDSIKANKDDINKLNKNKMDKNTTNISVSQINKNLGKLDQTYMTDEFLQQIAGETPISSTVANKSITNDKLADNVLPNFLHDVSTEMNYINNNTLTTGGLKSDGTVEPSVFENSVTDYISIGANTKIYRLNNNPVVVGFYNSEKTFIRRDTVNANTFTTPEGTSFMRYSSSTENVRSEVLSLFPVKYYTPFNTIANFRFGEKYKMTIPSIERKWLDNHFLDLSLNKFLSSTDNINNYTNDGLFIGINCINAPTTGTFIYENKGLKNGSNVRWIIQTAINLNNLNERYIRRIDVNESENNTNWCSTLSNKLYNKNLICFGDSITQGVGSTDEKTKSYPMIIQNKYGMNVINKGIAGATAGNYDDGYDDISLLTQIDNAELNNVDYATIFIGTNDFGRGNPGRIIGKKDDMIENTFTGALNIAVKKILEKNPKIKIVFITPMWRQRMAAGDNKDSDFNTFFDKYLIDYVNAMIQQGKYNHIPTLNLYDNCLINKYNYKTYLADGLHPNDYGYEYLADLFFEFISKNY